MDITTHSNDPKRGDEAGGQQELGSSTRGNARGTMPLLEHNTSHSMISHSEHGGNPSGPPAKMKDMGRRDPLRRHPSERLTLSLVLGSLSTYARRRQCMCLANLAVVLGSLFFFSSVHRRLWQGLSPPPIVLRSAPALAPDTWARRSKEPVQQTRRTQRPMQCATEGKFYSGTWVHAPTRPRPEVLYLAGDQGEGEAEFRSKDGLAFRPDVMLKYNQYDWVPSDPACEMVDWTVPGVCRLLERTNVSSILFVGDSITFQNAQSFYKMAGGQQDLSQFNPGWRSEICGDILPRPVTFRYVRNDILYTGTRPNEWALDFPNLTDGERRNVDIVFPWTPVLEEEHVGLLFINSGAHVHDFKFYKAVVHQAADFLQHNYRGKLVFRTSVPGHSSCAEWDRPTETDEEIVPYTEDEQNRYTWHYLEWFNLYAADLFGSMGAEIAYADRILKHRADGHVGLANDCLHYRLPGPPDWNTKVWYNVWLTKYADLLE